MKKVLITGCAGFIGSNLVDRLLEHGYKVTGIDCFSDYYPEEIKKENILNASRNRNFKLIEEDILNMNEYPEVDCVFHQAAQAGVRASWGISFEIYTRNNIEATQKLLEFYKNREIKKFVYASSSSVYGDAELPMREDLLLKPVSPYGVTKLAGENLCYIYWKNYNIPTVSLRYFTVYGPRQRPDMAIYKFVKAILNNEKIPIFGDGTQTRDFTFVDDVVEANILATESNITGEIFNIGGSSKISVGELIKKIEEILGKKAIIENIEKQKGDVKDTVADISKAEKILKWKPKIGINKGLEKYLKWYLRSGYNN